ncbi:type II toxin-antitoxin system CcdA family antitoxin [Jannaschia formosa]|uniref:type II toxin-antitoxin system CcdA family antitoxin n=1 Tax=Jannaschia formosa TaxID=2259592 RepID=UPI000E1C29F8|nr:type II toxin-antitoxin system CcdA family antitoxin [Jannaschia formosa]TFL18324.1 post-segregation antitoxin CcdA [Jannaschia formosa]
MPTRKTSLSLDADLLDEAKSYGINVSAAASSGLEAAVKAERQERLREELRPGIEAYNRWIAENGIPLAKYRKF